MVTLEINLAPVTRRTPPALMEANDTSISKLTLLSPNWTNS
ncbi:MULTISPECIES: hypothetical protein [Photorhabdus]